MLKSDKMQINKIAFFIKPHKIHFESALNLKVKTTHSIIGTFISVPIRKISSIFILFSSARTST